MHKLKQSNIYYERFRFLNISNSKVSDIGVFFLCGISNKPVVNGCKQLESFYARNTWITEAGVRMAVQCLEKLTFLDSKHLSTVNTQLESGRVLPPKAFLKSCVIGETGYLKLVFIVESHEVLRQTKVMNTGYVKNLNSIVDVRSDFPYQICIRSLLFPIEAVPFLMKFARDLHEIQLVCLSKIDICTLISTCPQLRIVNLFNCTFDVSSVPRPRIVPQHLEECIITNDYTSGNDSYLGHEELVSLLMSPNMRVIVLSNCHGLSDEVLETAFRHHRFRKLERITISKCNGVSRGVFDLCFMSETNSLNFIAIKRSPNLGTLKNKNEWLSIAAARSWDLDIVVVPL